LGAPLSGTVTFTTTATSTCEAKVHSAYGHGDAVQYVRVTCIHCDYFAVQKWCSRCLLVVQNSGKLWGCEGCDRKMNNYDKLRNVLRMGEL
jgi:hypothetical protein